MCGIEATLSELMRALSVAEGSSFLATGRIRTLPPGAPVSNRRVSAWPATGRLKSGACSLVSAWKSWPMVPGRERGDTVAALRPF